MRSPRSQKTNSYEGRKYNSTPGRKIKFELYKTRQGSWKPLIEGFRFRRGGPTSTDKYFQCIDKSCKVRFIKVEEDKGWLYGDHDHDSRVKVHLCRLEENEEQEVQDTPGATEEIHANAELLLDKMLNTEILTKAERKTFAEYAKDEKHTEMSRFLNTLRITDSKFGLGVTSSTDIPKDAFLGCYYGKLSRKLRKDAHYSFSIKQKTKRSKPLYVDSEEKGNRSVLAYCNHECEEYNAAAFLSGTEDGSPKIMFFAKKHIPAGKEITIFYSSSYFNKSHPCRCSTCEQKLNELSHMK